MLIKLFASVCFIEMCAAFYFFSLFTLETFYKRSFGDNIFDFIEFFYLLDSFAVQCTHFDEILINSWFLCSFFLLKSYLCLFLSVLLVSNKIYVILFKENKNKIIRFYRWINSLANFEHNIKLLTKQKIKINENKKNY